MTPKIYYLSLTFVNNEKQMAIVEWIEHNRQKVYLDVYPNSQKTRKTMFTSVTKPEPIQIAAIGKETNTPLLLDSKSSVIVTPKETKEMVTITIGQGRLCLQNYIEIS